MMEQEKCVWEVKFRFFDDHRLWEEIPLLHTFQDATQGEIIAFVRENFLTREKSLILEARINREGYSQGYYISVKSPNSVTIYGVGDSPASLLEAIDIVSDLDDHPGLSHSDHRAIKMVVDVLRKQYDSNTLTE